LPDPQLISHCELPKLLPWLEKRRGRISQLASLLASSLISPCSAFPVFLAKIIKHLQQFDELAAQLSELDLPPLPAVASLAVQSGEGVASELISSASGKLDEWLQCVVAIVGSSRGGAVDARRALSEFLLPASRGQKATNDIDKTSDVYKGGLEHTIAALPADKLALEALVRLTFGRLPQSWNWCWLGSLSRRIFIIIWRPSEDVFICLNVSKLLRGCLNVNTEKLTYKSSSFDLGRGTD
jgi:hypothetical protein